MKQTNKQKIRNSEETHPEGNSDQTKQSKQKQTNLDEHEEETGGREYHEKKERLTRKKRLSFHRSRIQPHKILLRWSRMLHFPWERRESTPRD